MLTPYDLIVLVSCTTFNFIPYGKTDPSGIRARYRRKGWLPPAWVFEVVWFLLYLDLSAATFFFWYGQEQDVLYYVGFAAILANVFLNGIWTKLYFEYSFYMLAIADAIAMLAASFTAVAACVFHLPNYTAIVAGVLFLPYIAWIMLVIVMIAYAGPLPDPPRVQRAVNVFYED